MHDQSICIITLSTESHQMYYQDDSGRCILLMWFHNDCALDSHQIVLMSDEGKFCGVSAVSEKAPGLQGYPLCRGVYSARDGYQAL